MLFAKFGLNLLSGSGEEDENVKSLQTADDSRSESSLELINIWGSEYVLYLVNDKYLQTKRHLLLNTR